MDALWIDQTYFSLSATPAHWRSAWKTVGDALLARAADLAAALYGAPDGEHRRVYGCDQDGELLTPWSPTTATLVGRVDDLVGYRGRQTQVTLVGAMLLAALAAAPRDEHARSAAPPDETWFGFSQFPENPEELAVTVHRTLRRASYGCWSSALWNDAVVLAAIRHPDLHLAARVVADETFDAVALAVGSYVFEPGWLADPALDPVQVIGTPRVFATYLDDVTRAVAGSFEAVPYAVVLGLAGRPVEATAVALAVAQQLLQTIAAHGGDDPLFDRDPERELQVLTLLPFLDSTLDAGEFDAVVDVARPGGPMPGRAEVLRLTAAIDPTRDAADLDDDTLGSSPVWVSWAATAMIVGWAAAVTGRPAPEVAAAACAAVFDAPESPARAPVTPAPFRLRFYDWLG